MSEIRVGGQPLSVLLEGYSVYFKYQFPIDDQNKFLMEVATEVKEESARLFCLKIYKFYINLAEKTTKSLASWMNRLTKYLVATIGTH